MTKSELAEKLGELVEQYQKFSLQELNETWSKLPLDLDRNEVFEVIGALLARQVTVANQIAKSPNIWNHHVAPVLLRTMADTHITLAWILKNPLERSQKFIYFGLGQTKLELEHRKAHLRSDGTDLESDPSVKVLEQWIDSQRWTFLTEVNVGSWSELSTREMAQEAGCLDFYRYAYTPFSGATHSMWHHVSRLNLKQCSSPLHRYHRVPDVPDLAADTFYLYLAAKYCEKSFSLIRSEFTIEKTEETAFQWLSSSMSDLLGPFGGAEETD